MCLSFMVRMAVALAVRACMGQGMVQLTDGQQCGTDDRYITLNIRRNRQITIRKVFGRRNASTGDLVAEKKEGRQG